MQGIWHFLDNPRRCAGIFGIIFIVLFVIAGPIMQSGVPTTSDSAAAMRTYWESDGDRYLAGDFLFGIAVIFFFMPFVVALRSLLEPADRSRGMWARTMHTGALIAVILGGAGAAASAALALNGAEGLDDSTLQFATRAGAYSTQGLAFGFALMLFAAAVVIARSGVLWRWLAVLAVLVAITNVVGGLWVPDGDQEGAFAVVGFIGLMGTLVWVLAVSIQMLVSGERVLVAQHRPADHDISDLGAALERR